MPKLKTHKGAKARFRITGTGKLMRMRGPRSHFRRNKSARVLRLLRQKVSVHVSDVKRIHKLLPNL